MCGPSRWTAVERHERRRARRRALDDPRRPSTDRARRRSPSHARTADARARAAAAPAQRRRIVGVDHRPVARASWFSKMRAFAAAYASTSGGDRGGRARSSAAPRSTGGTCRSSRAESCWPRRRAACPASSRRPARSAARRCCRRPAPRSPAASSIRPVSVVVVDLPFVPVIAITRPLQPARRELELADDRHAARARRRRRPAARAARPGSARSRSAPANVSARWPPSSSATPAPRSRVGAVERRRARSVSVTRAPRAREQLRGRNAASRRPDHHHAPSLAPRTRSSIAITAASASSG